MDFRKIARTLFVALLGLAALTAAGCGKSGAPAKTVIECRIGVIEPYLGSLTLDLVRAAQVGNPTPLRDALLNLGLTPREIFELSRRWHACLPRMSPESRAPSPDAGAPRRALRAASGFRLLVSEARRPKSEADERSE